MRKLPTLILAAIAVFSTLLPLSNLLATNTPAGAAGPEPPAVATSGVDNITTTSAVLRGNLTSQGTAASVTVFFEYGTTTAYGSTSTIESMTGAGTFSANVTGLVPGITYHFRARADGGVDGTAVGTDSIFATATTPPIVATSNATGVTNRTAIISGNLTSPGTASSINTFFEYGTTTGYGSTTTPQPMTGTGIFSANLTGLSENTTYHVRAKANAGVNGSANGSDITFTTLTSPKVVTAGSTNVTTDAAIVSANLTSLGTASAVIVSFEYGPTASYGSTTIAESMTGTGAFGASLTGLAPGATYHFRAKVDGGSHGISTSADMTFTTVASLAVSTNPATNVKINSATLNGNLVSLGGANAASAYFEYGTTIAYGGTTPPEAMTVTGTLSTNLAGLAPGTTYHFRMKADGGVYGTANGTDGTFTTLTPLAVSTSPASNVNVSTVTINGNLASTGEATAVNVYFEYGTTTAYGTTTLPQVMTAAGPFSVSLAGLEPGMIYHYRALAYAGVYGTATGVDVAVATIMPVPPVVGTNPATGITSSSAFLHSTVSSFGSAPLLKVYFEYGENTTYESMIVAQVDPSDTTKFNAEVKGLSPEVTYFYRAVADGGEHGISIGASANFTTLKPFSPMVRSFAAANITSGRATLNGALISLGQATAANVSFEYGKDTSYGATTVLVSLNVTGPFSANISGLDPGASYHFRAKVDGGPFGVGYSADRAFMTLPPEPPVVFTSGPTNVTVSSGNVSGNLTSLGTATAVNVYFEYGTTSSYGYRTASVSVNVTSPFNANIPGLIPGTTYHFRARADGGAHGAASGSDGAFTTAMPDPPKANTIGVNSVAIGSANVSGNLTSLGTATTVDVFFEYGTTLSYGNATAPVSVNVSGPFSANITGLNGGTTYYFRAKADAGLYGKASGASSSFTTLTIPPTVTTTNATVTAPTSANVSGNLTSLGTAAVSSIYFEYGLTAGYGGTTPQQPMTAAGPFSANITGLIPNTTYHFRAKVDGGVHGASSGADETFTTTNSTAPAVDTLPAAFITSSAAVVSGNLTYPGSAPSVSVSFDYGLTLAYGNTATPLPMNSTGVFSANLSGLSSNTTYHFRAMADGGIHGATAGIDMTFVTLPQPLPPPPPPPQGSSTTPPSTGGSAGGIGDRTQLIAKAETSGFGGDGPIVDGPNRITLNPATLTTVDGHASLDIPAGTTIKMPDGKAVTSFSAVPNMPSATPPQGAIILSYDFGPNGATFDPPLTLSFVYSDDQIPPGADETGLYMAYWDGSKWVKLDTTINAETETCTVKISHFSTFALIAPMKASAPIIPSVTPSLPPAAPPASGATTPPPPTSPTTEAAPAEFAISALSITPQTVKTGENVTIAAQVTNTGGTAGTYAVALLVNGAVEGRTLVTLDPGASLQVGFSVGKKAAGTYEVNVNKLVSSFVVERKASSRQWLIIGIALLVGLAGAAAYLLNRRLRVRIAEEPEESLTGKITRQEAKEAKTRARKEADEARQSARKQPQRAPVEEGAEPAKNDELYTGVVTMTIIPPIDFGSLWELHQYFQKAENLTVVRSGGSAEADTTIVVSLEKPLPLINLLKTMPPVAEVLKKDDKILVILRPNQS